MYCINCGVKLADTEQTCPLCGTVVFHPTLKRPAATPLYPSNTMPKSGSGKKAISGAILLLYFIPLILSLFSDLQMDFELDWAGYVIGGLLVSYVIFALPIWFQKPNPVIFMPCNFAAIILYLLYIAAATNGTWFLSFALPVTAGFGLILCTVITLLRYTRGGRLYIAGGALMALGALLLLTEYLLGITFQIPFIGWSVYPLIVLTLLGGLLIYLAINSSAREMLARKLFF